MTDNEVRQHMIDTGALLQGHFLLRSGLHSDAYFQAALVLQYTRTAALLCAELAKIFAKSGVETVISPAIGGIVVGQEVGRALGVRAIFAEKDDNSNLILRRGFSIRKKEKVLVAEDVITRGGRVQQTIDLVRGCGAEVAGVAVLVDRSAGKAEFDVPVHSLLKLNLPAYNPDECPLCRQNVPLVKPGSK